MNAGISNLEVGLPQRKRLPHEIPWWVAQGARHFITINAKCRGSAPFTEPSVAEALLRNLLAYETSERWQIWIGIIMPDHLHFIATFALESGLTASIRPWKAYQSRTLAVEFQSGFFEHRLRTDAEFEEKSESLASHRI